ncbi:MAG: HAD-IIIA family hydrolase [Bacteroidetes bacterium]|nr:HAD-IIIA family hydrolase [Bacteroidota bacterium]
MQRAVFFDRDGVVNTRILGGYVTKWGEFEWMPDVGATLQQIKDLGYLAIIITNQRGVGIGKMTGADLDAIHERMQTELMREFGVRFDDIISCTDATNDSVRRKPAPTMLFEARDKWGIDLARSYFVGDSPSDIEAGHRAGTKTVFLLNDHEAAPEDADAQIGSLSDLVGLLS